MAFIISLLREEVSQALLENGSSGVGALQVGELGYTEATQEFSFRNRVASAVRHITTREKMLLAAAAATSGAKGVGYFPAAGLSSVTVQDALDELRGQVAAGGGGTVIGTGTIGKLLKWSGTGTAADSILAEASGKINFSGDTVANLYRTGAGLLKTDGEFHTAAGLVAGTNLTALEQAYFFKDTVCAVGLEFGNAAANNDSALYLLPTVNKSNSNTRQFNILKLYPTLNHTGTATTLNIIDVDTLNTAVGGLVTNLAMIKYGGSQRLRLQSNGDFSISPDGTTIGLAIDSYGLLSRESNSGVWDSKTASGTSRIEIFNSKSTGTVVSPTDIGTTDIISIEYAKGYSGGAYREGAKQQTVVDGAFTTGQNPPIRHEFYTAKANSADTLRLAIMSSGNIGFHTTSAFGTGERVWGIQDCTTAPTTNPAGGGVFYSEAGALKWRGSSGTITTIAPA